MEPHAWDRPAAGPEDMARSPWTLGDLRALLEAVPAAFDRTPLLLEHGGHQAVVASIDLANALTIHAG